MLEWITSFLTNRKERIVVNEFYSCWSDVIPQGSVLGQPVARNFYWEFCGQNSGPFCKSVDLIYKIEDIFN